MNASSSCRARLNSTVSNRPSAISDELRHELARISFSSDKSSVIRGVVLACCPGHVLVLPQRRHRIDSGRSPRRREAGENRGGQEDETSQRQRSRVIGLGGKQE